MRFEIILLVAVQFKLPGLLALPLPLDYEDSPRIDRNPCFPMFYIHKYSRCFTLYNLGLNRVRRKVIRLDM